MPTPPVLTPFARFEVALAPPVDLGTTWGEHRRVVPIVGGRVTGRLAGRILPGGADDQVLRTPTRTELDARYAIETDSGAVVRVRNRGVRTGSREDIAAIVAGRPVDAARIRFHSTPVLGSDDPEWAWLADRVFVAIGERTPDAVLLEVHLLE